MALPRRLDTPGPSALSRERVAEGITTQLRELVLSGQLRGGEPLRIEHLAALMGVSNTPVRESLLELHSDGFVTREPRKGYVVARLTPAGFRDQVLVLAMVTGELAARAALVVRTDQLELLQDLQHRLDRPGKSRRRDVAEDINHRWHSTVNKIASSSTLADIAQRTSRYIPRFTWQSLRTRPATCSYDHHAIIEALALHDAEAARSAMFSHLIASGDQVIAQLKATGFWGPDDELASQDRDRA